MRSYQEASNTIKLEDKANDTVTSPVSWLKYSTTYEMMGDAPVLAFGRHVKRTLVAAMSDTTGFEGAPGNVDGSRVRWKMMEGLEGASTMSAALHVVSPVSLTALHVYIAVSDNRKPANNIHTCRCQYMNVILILPTCMQI